MSYPPPPYYNGPMSPRGISTFRPPVQYGGYPSHYSRPGMPAYHPIYNPMGPAMHVGYHPFGTPSTPQIPEQSNVVHVIHHYVQAPTTTPSVQEQYVSSPSPILGQSYVQSAPVYSQPSTSYVQPQTVTYSQPQPTTSYVQPPVQQQQAGSQPNQHSATHQA